MDDHSHQMEIGVDIGAEQTPRLRFSIAEQATNVALSPEGATRLAGSLLTSCFLCSIGRNIPEGTPVSSGKIPVTASKVQIDPDTNLPTLTISLMGGGELTFIFSADLAVESGTGLANEGINAARNVNYAPAPR